MPRNTTTSSIFDPLNQPDMVREREGLRARPELAPSVIDPYHPANARRHASHNDSGTYTYRQRNIKLNFTLGWELEANHAPYQVPAGVEHISDGSVDGDGAEFVVLPAVTKSPRYVLGLLKDLVHAPRLNTNKSCGFHVHVSASNLSSIARLRQWAIATEHLALQVEPLAFSAVPDARHGNEYCRKIVPISHGTTFTAHKYNNSRRYHWLNIVEMFRPNGIRTIEVRLLGNTHRWKYLLAWTLFSMELARRGWEVANKPFDAAGHVDALGLMLRNIAKDIRPLEKKSEPIPQWVWDGLKTFGIGPEAWERPLSQLTDAELDLRGMPRRVYTDNQPLEATPRNEDNDDYCPCGCDTEGRCDQQVHDDGDCDSHYCYPCHGEDNCGGVEARCEWCIERAHEDGEDCGRSSCSTCHSQTRRRVTAVSPQPLTTDGSIPASPPISAAFPEGEPVGSVTTAPEGALTPESMRAAIDAMRNMRIDNTMLQVAAYDAMVRGEGMAHIVYDEAAHTAPAQWTEIDGRLWTTNYASTSNGPSIPDMLEHELMTEAEADLSLIRERESLGRLTGEERALLERDRARSEDQ